MSHVTFYFPKKWEYTIREHFFVPHRENSHFLYLVWLENNNNWPWHTITYTNVWLFFRWKTGGGGNSEKNCFRQPTLIYFNVSKVNTSFFQFLSFQTYQNKCKWDRFWFFIRKIKMRFTQLYTYGNLLLKQWTGGVSLYWVHHVI